MLGNGLRQSLSHLLIHLLRMLGIYQVRSMIISSVESTGRAPDRQAAADAHQHAVL